jgi:hypothetical protein
MIAMVAVGTVATSGCAGDAFVGTYAYAESNTFTITAPMMGTPMTGTASGTLDIAIGTGADYRVTIHAPAGAGGSDCALLANRGASDTLTFAAGQSCMVSGNGATGTATLSSGTGSLSGTTLTLNLSYAVAGTSPMGVFSATTVDVDTAMRQ